MRFSLLRIIKSVSSVIIKSQIRVLFWRYLFRLFILAIVRLILPLWSLERIIWSFSYVICRSRSIRLLNLILSITIIIWLTDLIRIRIRILLLNYLTILILILLLLLLLWILWAIITHIDISALNALCEFDFCVSKYLLKVSLVVQTSHDRLIIVLEIQPVQRLLFFTIDGLVHHHWYKYLLN